MFERLGSLTYRFRFLIVIAWGAAAAWAVLFAPSLAAEGMTDQTAFLPPHVASMQAHEALEEAFPGSTSVSSTQLVFSREGGLTVADHGYIDATAAWVAGDQAPELLRDAVTSVETAASRPELEALLRSEDGALEMVNVNLDVVMAGAAGDAVVGALREHLAATAPAGLAANVTGAGGIGSDYLTAIVAGTDSTTLVTIILVIVILLLIYRAPLAAMIPLVTIAAAFVVARGTLGVLAVAGWKVSSLIDTFIVVLIFGVGTDYAIFLISRFREEVARGDWHDAARTTVGRIGAVISASAATVIVGLGAMAFGDFGMVQTTGPALAIGIAVTLAANLTLTPALLGIFGHYLFWPRHTHAPGEGRGGAFFAWLAALVSRRPGVVSAVLLVGLFVPALYLPQMRTNFDVLAELPASSDARAGFDAVAEHLGRGEVFQGTGIVAGGAGADLLEPAALARLLDLARELQADPGVASVTSLVTPEGDGALPDGFRPSAQLAEMARAFDDGDGAPSDSEALLDPEVTDGLETMATYLGELGTAFPDLANGSEMRAATAVVATARERVEAARDGALVSTQLRTLADAMTSPAAAAGGSTGGTGSISVIDDYLAELAAAYPEVEALPAFPAARDAVARLQDAPSIAAALDLAAALETLATHFDGRPGATLVPASLAGTPEAREARRRIEATFAELPVDLRALAAVLAARPDDVFLPTGLGGDEGRKLDDAIAAFVSRDRTATRFYLSTTDDPYSREAFATVGRAQEILAAAAPTFGAGGAAHLGGTTAQFSDVETTLAADFQKVGLITILGILLVLMLLLRAVVAPLYLVGTVLLSCGTALGLSSWFFQEVLGQPGVSFYLPILVFVLLVAIGSDYNIFLMSRVREESAGREIHEGVRIASGRTGAVITSAGLILAGTFAAMMTADLVVLFQVGFAVALGVLIDTFLVRSILVPAITTLFGERAWWPSGSALARRGWPVVVTVPEPAGAPAGMSRRRLGVALAIVALVPGLVAGLLVWSLADREAHLSGVTAAVVNEDAGTTVNDADGSRRLALGADLVAELTAGAEPDSFGWVAADAATAAAGLADGTYGAVLAIPSDFSTTIAAITADGDAAHRATLRLQTNDATSYGLGTIARSVSAAIAAATSQTVTADYVDRVLVRVNGTRDAVAGAADRAASLAAGTTDLADSAAETSVVAAELVAGLRELTAGAAAAGDGVGELATAVTSLASGTERVATGAASLGDGADAAVDGAGALADGAGNLADGLATLAASTADLPARAGQLANGAAGVAAGADGVATGSRTLAEGLATLAAGTAGLGAQAAQLDAGAAALTNGVASLAAGAGQAAAAASSLASGAQGLATSIADYTGSVAALSAGCVALGGSDPLCAQLAALAAGGGALNGGATTLAGGAGELAAGSAGVATGAAELASGAAALRAGTSQLAAQAPQLEGAIAQASSGAAGLATGTAELAAGSRGLADGTATFAASVPALAGAIVDAAAGARALADGTAGVASGVARLASGVDGLAAGARASADGAAELASGAAAAAAGASQLVDGMGTAAEGARLVAAEVDGLASDGRSSADAATGLAAGLRDDAVAIPTRGADERAALGRVVAAPVAVEASRMNPLTTSGAGLAPTFIAISLWVGALAIYLVVPALLGRPDRRRWWRGALAGLAAGAAIGVGQALLTVLLLRLVLGIEVARLPELLAWTAFAAVVFAAIVQALVVLFEYRGWLLALLLLVLQVAAAGVLLPAATAPALLELVNAVLPLGYVIDVARSLIAGGVPALAPGLAVLAAWLVGSLLVTLAAAFRSSTAPGLPDATEAAAA